MYINRINKRVKDWVFKYDIKRLEWRGEINKRDCLGIICVVRWRECDVLKVCKGEGRKYLIMLDVV